MRPKLLQPHIRVAILNVRVQMPFESAFMKYSPGGTFE